MIMNLQEVAVLLNGVVKGNPKHEVHGISVPDSASVNHLCVVWERSMLSEIALDIPLLTLPEFLIEGRLGVAVSDPRGALIPLLKCFDERQSYEPGIASSCDIAPSCTLGEDVCIGAHCILSDRASVGARTVLQGNVYVGRDVVIGDDCHIAAGVVLQDGVRIGDRVIIHGNSVLGSDGFGFIRDKEGRQIRIPQIGTVVIEDDVEIGAHVAIDRATFGQTHVGRGTKIGNYVQIAHNTQIGEDCIFVGFIAMGGTVKIGNGSLIAGMTGVADHITIAEGVTVAGRSGVTKDIPENQIVSGYPAQDHRAEQRLQAQLRRVPQMGERLKEVEKRLEKLETIS